MQRPNTCRGAGGSPVHSVAFVATDLAQGGAETQMVHLATRMKARGWDIHVGSLIEPKEGLGAELAAAGITVASLGMRPGVPDPRALWRLATLFRNWRPEVVHSHMVHANLLARMARPLAWVPVLISSAHNINEGGRQREIAYRLTDPLCDLTTNVSRAAVERYVRVRAAPAHRIRFMPNGVDTAVYRPGGSRRATLRARLGIDTEFVWLAVGRLEAAKDPLNLVRAFAAVVRSTPHAVLLVVGQGTLAERIRREAADLGLASRVRLLGLRSDVPELMRAADAYVMSSAWEGMPLVLLEAAASGLPVVATDVGGNREVVLHGTSGLLVPPHEPDALSRSMISMMGRPAIERRRMGQAGRSHVVEHYALQRIVLDWEALYLELLARKAGSKYLGHPANVEQSQT